MTMTLFIQILNMSLGAAWAALLVILARPLLRRFSHRCCYALWGVVLFRLVCPVSFSSVLSLMPRPRPIPQEIVYAQTPQVESGFALFDQAVNQSLSSVPAAAPPPVVATPAVSAAVSPVQAWLEAGSLVWQVGMALLLLYGLVSYLHFLGSIQGAVLVGDNVWESDRIPTAFVLGLARPKIYLPIGLKEDEKRYVLCHEQTHIRRLDHIIKPVSLLLLTVHWFNPVLWLAWFLMRRDMEMSCDELALKKLGEENRKGYSACLLNLSARQSGLAAPLAFGENDVKGRIVNILRYKKPALFGTVLSVVLAGALGFCLLSNPSEDSGPLPADPGQGSGLTVNYPGEQGWSDISQLSKSSENNDDGVIHYTAPVQGSSQQTLHDNHLDYGVDLGTPVYSPIRGTVEEFSDHSAGPYGKTVVVRSSENPDVILTMAHLQTIAEGLKAGDPVDSDTQLGTAGATGYATGPIVAVVVQEMTDGGQALAVPVERWDNIFINWRDGISGDPLNERTLPEPTDDPVSVIHYTAPVRSSSQQGIKEPHELEYHVDYGTPIYSPIRGVVEEFSDYSYWPYGKTVAVRSSENPDIVLVLAHLGAVAEDLKVGDPVDSAIQIGIAGTTGNASFPTATVVVRRKTGDGQLLVVPMEEWDAIFDNWRDGISGEPDPDPYTVLSPIRAACLEGEVWASPRELKDLPHLYEDLAVISAPSNGDRLSVAQMVETLSHYFENITAQDIIASGDYVYDPATDTILYNWEGARVIVPVLLNLTSWERKSGEDELLIIDYKLYHSGENPDTAASRRLTVKLLADGSFRYLSNLEPGDPGNP